MTHNTLKAHLTNREPTPHNTENYEKYRMQIEQPSSDILHQIIRIVKNDTLPAFILDEDLTIRYISDAAYNLFKNYYVLESKPLFNIFGAIFNTEEIKSFLQSIRSKEKGYTWSNIITHKSRIEKTLKTDTLILPFFTEKHTQPRGYWMIFKDVTDDYMASYKEMLNGLLAASRLKDNETGLHAERLNHYCRYFSQYLQALNIYPQITPDFVENISFLPAIHDIGKIGTPDYILRKEGKLTPTEWEIMKEHTINGALIVSSFPLPMAKEITLSHHERWDGTGYPFKLAGEMIPLSARITAIADVYDALRSKRSYKDSFSHHETIKNMFEGSGSHFDPNLMKHFLKCHMGFDRIWNTVKDNP